VDRRYLGIELDAEYRAIAGKRLAKAPLPSVREEAA
jgi:hypothetical protein